MIGLAIMARILSLFGLLLFMIIFRLSNAPQFGDACYVSSVCRGDEQNNCSCPSLDSNLRNLIGSLPETSQPNSTTHEWKFRMLTIMAAAQATLILVTVFITRCIVTSAIVHAAENIDQIHVEVLKEQKRARTVEGNIKVLQRELDICEREQARRRILLMQIRMDLNVIDCKCCKKEASLVQKQVDELENARIMRAQEGLKGYKRKMKDQIQTNAIKVTFQDEWLSSQIEETERIRSLLEAVKTGLVEIQGPMFDCSAGCSCSQFPSPPGKKGHRYDET